MVLFFTEEWWWEKSSEVSFRWWSRICTELCWAVRIFSTNEEVHFVSHLESFYHVPKKCVTELKVMRNEVMWRSWRTNKWFTNWSLWWWYLLYIGCKNKWHIQCQTKLLSPFFHNPFQSQCWMQMFAKITQFWLAIIANFHRIWLLRSSFWSLFLVE